MMQTNNLDVAIIGGGMVGASLALLLARQMPECSIAILEAQPFAEDCGASYLPSFDARSTALALGSVEILRTLGVWQELARHATAITQVHVSDAGHFMGGLIDAKAYDLAALGYVLPNAWMGRVLLARVQSQANIRCLAPAKVQQLIPQQQGALLVVNSGGESLQLTCKLALVADGGDSPLRKMLGIEAQVKDYQQTAVIANVAYSEPHNGVAYERFTELGPLALLPLGVSPKGRESALVLTLPSAQAEALTHCSDAEFLAHLQQRFGQRLGQFLRVSGRHAYPLSVITASEQIRSHIALVGNAAHFLHPVAGQGFNLSLRDCACLVASLTQAQAQGQALGELSALQAYIQRQQLDQALTIEFSDKLVRLFSSAALPLIALRHLGFLGLDLLPRLKQTFADQTMGRAGAKFL